VNRRAATLLATILGSAIVFLDSTVVNVALDTIGKELPATFVARLEGLTYVNSGYFAVLSALLILAGALNDFYGRRRMFRIGLIGFGVASVVCGLAPSLEILVAARILQAAFGAVLVPGSLSIITAAFTGEERGRAIGLWAAGTSATSVIGPVIGGLLVQSISWRAAFLINIPLVLLALWATREVEESRDEQASGRFDWLGAAVIAVGVGGLAFGATRGQERAWQDTLAFVALSIGFVATAIFPLLMLRRPRISGGRIELVRPANPLVPLELFRSRNFSIVNISTFVIYGALYVSLVFQALFFQGTLGYTPIAAGAVGIPVGLLLTFLSTPAGTLSARFGPRMFMTIGPVIMAAAFLWYARIPATSTPWLADPGDLASFVPPLDTLVDVILGSVIFGIGISFLVAPLTTALMASVPVQNAGLGSAINNAISRVGQPLIGAALFIVITATFYPSLASRIPGTDVDSPEVREQVQPLTSVPETVEPELAMAAREASTDAFHLAMLVSAGLCLAGAGVNALGIRNPSKETVEASPGAVA
jgi:EmrB/QacA subfamily drug resistance transporter